MKKLIQVIYISRSTFESTVNTNKIEPNVARILAKSRVNNRANGLVGVLYFGDGVFFQCLEGEEDKVDKLLATLALDTRHKDLTVISRKYIDKLSFVDWAMKFAPLDDKITTFLRENGFQKFDPYLFTEELVGKFLIKLFNSYDLTIESNTDNASSISINERPNQVNKLKSVQFKSNLAMMLSVLALLVSLANFFH